MLPVPHALMDTSDRKLYTLLALEELGGCTHLQLLYFMFENDIMSYFDLSLALHELVKEGLAVKTAHPCDYLYTPTDAGRETLAFFLNRLAHSKVSLIRGQAPAWRERFAREQQFVGKITQNERGEYVVNLILTDGCAPLMTVSVPTGEHELAERMTRAWPTCAAQVYRQLLDALSDAQEES